MYAERRFEVEVPELPALADWQRVLLGAAEIVERGWCQGAAAWHSGEVCMAEAITVSEKLLKVDWEQRIIARQRVWSSISHSSRDKDWATQDNIYATTADIILWNDTPGRTQTEVIVVLHECARA